jgi:hypothetical protein
VRTVQRSLAEVAGLNLAELQHRPDGQSWLRPKG